MDKRGKNIPSNSSAGEISLLTRGNITSNTRGAREEGYSWLFERRRDILVTRGKGRNIPGNTKGGLGRGYP